MEEGIGESMQLAESKQDLPYVIKSHAFKRKFNESKADLRVLENKYSDLEKAESSIFLSYTVLDALSILVRNQITISLN